MKRFSCGGADRGQSDEGRRWAVLYGMRSLRLPLSDDQSFFRPERRSLDPFPVGRDQFVQHLPLWGYSSKGRLIVLIVSHNCASSASLFDLHPLLRLLFASHSAGVPSAQVLIQHCPATASSRGGFQLRSSRPPSGFQLQF